MLKLLLKKDAHKNPSGINAYIVSASMIDRVHWFNVIRIGNVINIADAAGSSLRYLTEIYVEDNVSSFIYVYNDKRLQYSSGCCETFAIELPFYWLRLWAFNDNFENVVFDDDGFPKPFGYFDEFAFGRIQPKRGQTQIKTRTEYMQNLGKKLDMLNVNFGFNSVRHHIVSFKDVFDFDFIKSEGLLGHLGLFPENEVQGINVPDFVMLGHILFQTQRNIEYYNRGFSRLITKRLKDTYNRKQMLKSIQTKSPKATFCLNNMDPLSKIYNEIECMYGFNAVNNTKNIASIVINIKGQSNFGFLPHLVAWNEDFREDLLNYVHKNLSVLVTVSKLFFEGQPYVEEIIKKYEIFEELEQQTIDDQKWISDIFPKAISFIKIVEGSDRNLFIDKFAEKVLDVSLREGFFESLSAMNL